MSQLPTVSILVDVQNVYYTVRQQFGCSFDYNRLWAQVTEGRQLVQAIAYTCDRGDAKQKQFQNILRAIGFEVKLKPYIKRADGSSKCDWDVGITIDAMELSSQSDVVVLLTGDGDSALLADKLVKDKDCQVEVYGVEQLTAAALMRAATRYFPIADDLLLN